MKDQTTNEVINKANDLNNLKDDSLDKFGNLITGKTDSKSSSTGTSTKEKVENKDNLKDNTLDK